MTLGELYDRLTAVREAEEDIERAHIDILHGGNECTMKRKNDDLVSCLLWLQKLRDEPL